MSNASLPANAAGESFRARGPRAPARSREGARHRHRGSGAGRHPSAPGEPSWFPRPSPRDSVLKARRRSLMCEPGQTCQKLRNESIPADNGCIGRRARRRTNVQAPHQITYSALLTDVRGLLSGVHKRQFDPHDGGHAGARWLRAATAGELSTGPNGRAAGPEITLLGMPPAAALGSRNDADLEDRPKNQERAARDRAGRSPNPLQMATKSCAITFAVMNTAYGLLTRGPSSWISHCAC